MSEQEKLAQIGEAALLCEEQKRSLAHLTEKIAKVRTAYATFASQSERWQAEAANPESVYLMAPTPEERGLPNHLLGQSQLAALILEYQKAKEALAQTRVKLAGFGVTSR